MEYSVCIFYKCANPKGFKICVGFQILQKEFKDIPIYYVPISERQAILMFNLLRSRERIYGYCSEIWEAIRRKKKGKISEQDVLSGVLISMVEQELNLKSIKMEVPYFWRKSLMMNEN